MRRNVQEIPETTTAAGSPMLPPARRSAKSFTTSPASEPRVPPLLHSIPRPRLSCFTVYLLLFFYDMFQAGNHEFRCQGTKPEPRTPRLQGRDDLGQIVTDEAESGIFSEFLNH